MVEYLPYMHWVTGSSLVTLPVLIIALLNVITASASVISHNVTKCANMQRNV